MARIVITGGAGFLGSHLTDRLIERGDEVICLDNLITGRKDNISHLGDHERFTFVRHDVSEPIDIDGPVDAVLHFASPASPPDFLTMPIEILEVGSLGTRNALALAHAKSARFMVASTSEVYGDPRVHPQTEDYWGNVNPIGPRSCYDEAKRFGEAITMAYHRHHGVDVAIVRIFNTYGPRMRPDDGRVVSNFLVQALAGQPLTIYGDGSQTRSFCFVDDEVRGFVAMLDSGLTGPVNIGNPNEFSVAELAEIVIEVTGSASDIVYRPLPQDDPTQRRPDITMAVGQLGWQPEVELREGLRLTAAHFAAV